MSSALPARLLAALVLAGAILCGGGALASAGSLEDLLTGQLLAPSAPALLGPITSSGRKGWECAPERAAGNAQWKAAELPAGPEAP